MAHLLLYDGVCGLCHRVTRFVLKRDRGDKFRFASLQSALATEALARHGRSPEAMDTIYVVADYGGDGERLLVRGRAGLFVLREIGGAWRLLAAFRILPDFVLDAVYNFVARNRYRWFGRYQSCPLPEPAHRHKFLDVT